MAVKTKEEIMNFIKERTKDDTSDETLAFIEDVNDTFNDYDTKVHDSTDWKQKYEDNDKQWREKYRNRFFSGEPDSNKPDNSGNDNSGNDTNDDVKEKRTFADLFNFSKNKPEK